ncbi:hypothetical protein DFH07DRAFT_950540 [Mycena maculata]|uniref:Uncharacterized protein n=1 Tax=Mycena maculata TaxID=230809 RepID=A0AAD7K6P4_9AGAR|nr:hypothetical protein DFH07DRAFT_950540 [Mycena maculata]
MDLQAFVARIAACLAGFTMLKYLAFSIDCDPLFLPVSTSPGPPIVLQTRSSACPTFKDCIFTDFFWTTASGEWSHTVLAISSRRRLE